MIQAALIFLVVIALLGIGGKWLRGTPRKRGPAIEAAVRCQVCDTFVVGGKPGRCARPGCPHGSKG